jgi:N-acetylglutamate synthase
VTATGDPRAPIEGSAPELETLAARAWPALEAERVDGWLLRATPSVQRRRLNSALPLGDSAAVQAVERFYRERGMTPLVQVAPAEQLGALDAELAARGWRADGPTDMLVASCDEPPGSPSDVVVSLLPAVDRAWLETWIAAEGRPDAHETHTRVLRRVRSPAAFAIASIEGMPAGVGLAVCDRGWSGVFCMATDPAARRRGVARAVLRTLARWSREQGAGGLYLQVECDNAPAQALYASMGFERSHGYHFRVAPSTTRGASVGAPRYG